MLARLLHRLQGRQPVFMVNQGAGGEQVRVNLRTAVNAADIRTEQYNGREHLVLPSYTLPDDVIMNGGLYPHDEIEKSYNSLENTPAPLGHPQLDGEYISAYHPAAINAYHGGAFNRNVRREGNRIYLEKWVDTEFAKTNAKGQELLAAVANKQPIHTSTGVLLSQEKVAANSNLGYNWIARNMRFDHDAILINETGAATPGQGVGMFVNVSDAVPVLSDDSYEAKRDKLAQAVSDKFETKDKWVYVDDFDAVSLVYCIENDYFRCAYSIVGDVVTLSAQSEPVERKTTFTLKSTVNKILNMLRGHVVSEPETAPLTNTEASEMTLEEMQKLLDAQSEKQAVANADALTKALEPIQTELASVKAANADLSAKLTANTAAAEAEKKTAVAAEFGELVANSLTGEALDAMFAKCAKAAPLLHGLPVTNKSEGDAMSRLID